MAPSSFSFAFASQFSKRKSKKTNHYCYYYEAIIRLLCNQVNRTCEWKIVNDRSKCFGRRQGCFIERENRNFHFVCAKLILPLLVVLFACGL